VKKTVSALVAFFMLIVVFWPIRAVADVRTGPSPDLGTGPALAPHLNSAPDNDANLATGRDIVAFRDSGMDGDSNLAPMLNSNPACTRQDLDKFLDEFLPPAMTRLHVPGVVFVAVKDGEVLTMRGLGYSDIESGKEVDPLTTVFRAGSVSKVFTGMAVMQLVEGGILDLDEDVNTYIEGFKIPDTYPQPITLRHLLTHTAGFDERNLGTSEFGQDVYPELGQYLADELPPRVRPPGQLLQYSNHGMALAG
jgi:CubicO group peptidase (beta-lactamase class C family)